MIRVSLCNLYRKMLRRFRENDRFLKILKNLHIDFNLSQNASPILMLNNLVMVSNEGPIACKCFKIGNIRDICFNIFR